MDARVIGRPTESQLARVDQVKLAVGDEPLEGDERFWILGEPLFLMIDTVLVTVSSGFITDGASVPKLAQHLTGWDPWEIPQRWPAVAHDWLYCERDTAKTYADTAFRALLVNEGANWYQSTVMHWAVKLFGGWAYRSDQDAGPRMAEHYAS